MKTAKKAKGIRGRVMYTYCDLESESCVIAHSGRAAETAPIFSIKADPASAQAIVEQAAKCQAKHAQYQWNKMSEWMRDTYRGFARAYLKDIGYPVPAVAQRAGKGGRG
jgi:hypothetical protein